MKVAAYWRFLTSWTCFSLEMYRL